MSAVQESRLRGDLQSLSDEQLAHQAQEGCAASFEELVRRYQVPVLHFLRRKAFAVNDVEDLTQETFLRAYRKLGHYRSDRAFRPWLFTVAFRVALNAARDRKRAEQARPMEDLTIEARPSSRGKDDPETHLRLWSIAEDALSEPQFTALWLFYVEQLSVREIGCVLGRSAASVKTTLFRARKRLEPFLRRFTSEGERPGSPAGTITTGKEA
ncbi:MAG: sigma-70 family RNA polymerase sigma factor [Thermogutta sp.]|nr:sigma-70 family RNA polymerase sigma factor [Thermogutta sp.]